MAFLDPSRRHRCPCCGYPTLGSRSGYEVCRLCSWEDDGQNDPHADEIWGGPNHGYSLTQARENFRRFLVMYEPERDLRIGGPDRPEVQEVKRQLIASFERLNTASSADHPAIVQEIRKHERQLAIALKESIRAHDLAVRRARQTPRLGTD